MTKESNPVDIFCSMAWKTYCCFCLLVWFFAAIAVVLKVSSSRNKIVEPKTSPKKQMNEFVFLSWWLRNTWSLNLDFKFQVFLSHQDRKTNSFVCFLGEVTAQQIFFQDLLTFNKVNANIGVWNILDSSTFWSMNQKNIYKKQLLFKWGV